MKSAVVAGILTAACVMAGVALVQHARGSSAAGSVDDPDARFAGFVGGSFVPDAETDRAGYIRESQAALGCPPPASPLPGPGHPWHANATRADLLYSEGPIGDDLTGPSIGNGYVAWRFGSAAMYVSGAYNGPAQSANPSHAAAIPSPLNWTATLESRTSKSRAHPRQRLLPAGAALDMAEATVVVREEVAEVSARTGAAGAAGAASVAEAGPLVQRTWFAHRSLRSVVVHETVVTADARADPDTVLRVSNSGTRPPATTDFAWEQVSAPGCPEGAVCMRGTTLSTETNATSPTTVAVITTASPSAAIPVATGGSFLAITAVRTSLDVAHGEDPVVAAARDYSAAAATPGTALRASHLDAWSAVLAGGGIEVDCLSLAQAVNSSSYYILISARDDWPYSLSPQALSEGEGDDPDTYRHHVFWDCETWQLPHLTTFHPGIARSVLRYRFDRREGARVKAASYGMGWRGTMYPWESAFTGLETCPTWAATGLLEQHITADIGVAVWQAWRAWRDEAWLREVGAPLLYGIADFWASRVVERDGRFHIPDVIPPDEYAYNVTDSVYTNAAAALSLIAADAAARVLNDAAPDPAWRKVAENMHIPYNASTGVHPEYTGYVNETIKQADVILLGFPLQWPHMEPGSRLRDLEFYGPRTDPNGPAMTWGMTAVGLLEAGAGEAEAAGVFRRSYANISPPFGVWFEVPGQLGAANFITGAGGFLQGTLAGYGGVRILDDKMLVTPRCPPGTDRVAYRGVSFAGARFDIRAARDRSAASITFTAAPSATGPGATATASSFTINAPGLPAHGELMTLGKAYVFPIAQPATVAVSYPTRT